MGRGKSGGEGGLERKERGDSTKGRSNTSSIEKLERERERPQVGNISDGVFQLSLRERSTE